MSSAGKTAGAGNPVIRNCAQCLVHVPDLVPYGSKPWREIQKDPSAGPRLMEALRSFPQAVAYPPNQTFIGNLTPDQLAGTARPWFGRDDEQDGEALCTGPFGEIVSQDLFFGILKAANVLTPPLIEFVPEHRAALKAHLAEHPVLSRFAEFSFVPQPTIEAEIADGSALALRSGETRLGGVRRDNRAEGREDENLDAHTLLETLCVKASGAIALQWLLHREAIDAADIDFVISCGEEAAGDRYQRGAGGMAKSIAQMCACTSASGMDVKNFCAGPASALITAGALVKSGLYKRVAVVAGGSLAKLGMKYQSFLQAGMPVLDDCLGAMAFLVTPDDGASPVLHMEPGAVGTASIGASTSDEAVYRELILEPLKALGLGMSDVDKFAPELHNPEIMEHSGSGDVVHKNYRLIAAIAVLAEQITKAEMPGFVEKVGMTGFAPTQGHIPSAVPFMGHAMQAMRDGAMRRAMFLCKASLFLNRVTELYDGVSFLLEANPQASR
ncbi:MAG: glycine/sarcosine/betaine reductase complex component C subunit beta [Alphaproteobacteria bacterium]|nr:glycine/sarcosine/betaine reductase complex component C subunit beta [Alphaproteobacteria bacterium]